MWASTILLHCFKNRMQKQAPCPAAAFCSATFQAFWWGWGRYSCLKSNSISPIVCGGGWGGGGVVGEGSCQIDEWMCVTITTNYVNILTIDPREVQLYALTSWEEIVCTLLGTTKMAWQIRMVLKDTRIIICILTAIQNSMNWPKIAKINCFKTNLNC